MGCQGAQGPAEGVQGDTEGLGVPSWRLGTLRDLGRAEGLVFPEVSFLLRDPWGVEGRAERNGSPWGSYLLTTWGSRRGVVVLPTGLGTRTRSGPREGGLGSCWGPLWARRPAEAGGLRRRVPRESLRVAQCAEGPG